MSQNHYTWGDRPSRGKKTLWQWNTNPINGKSMGFTSPTLGKESVSNIKICWRLWEVLRSCSASKKRSNDKLLLIPKTPNTFDSQTFFLYISERESPKNGWTAKCRIPDKRSFSFARGVTFNLRFPQTESRFSPRRYGESCQGDQHQIPVRVPESRPKIDGVIQSEIDFKLGSQ